MRSISTVSRLALSAFALGACSATDAIAPVASVASPRFALVNETGTPMVCNATAPVTVSVTTVDRRGRSTPAAGTVVSFRAMNAFTDLFAGVGITNANGQVSDQITAGRLPGRPIEVEVRSVEAGTGVAVTHLSLTRAVVMGASAKLEGGFFRESYIPGLISTPAGVNLLVTPGCAVGGGTEPILLADTPVEITLTTGAVVNRTLSGASNALTVTLPSGLPSGVLRVKVGSAATGILQWEQAI
jgi:hypothetical protein